MRGLCPRREQPAMQSLRSLISKLNKPIELRPRSARSGRPASASKVAPAKRGRRRGGAGARPRRGLSLSLSRRARDLRRRLAAISLRPSRRHGSRPAAVKPRSAGRGLRSIKLSRGSLKLPGGSLKLPSASIPRTITRRKRNRNTIDNRTLMERARLIECRCFPSNVSVVAAIDLSLPALHLRNNGQNAPGRNFYMFLTPPMLV